MHAQRAQRARFCFPVSQHQTVLDIQPDWKCCFIIVCG